MTLSSLIAALGVGATIGVCGRTLVPGGSRTPLWLAVAVGVGAAMLATIVARLAGVDGTGVSPIEVTAQSAAAGAAIAVVRLTADRRPAEPRREARR
jgi:uncharacterized membrane protein YeaQ/YmgE (transglycosylase-associated protein family)